MQNDDVIPKTIQETANFNVSQALNTELGGTKFLN